jgi:UDP:flavonoid glycosyltransferase YjiC (YdhE family)
MRLILATAGTLGDHLPMLGLGCALQQQGFSVLIACNRAVHDLARRAGLAVTPFCERLGPQQAAGHSIQWDHWLRMPDRVAWEERDQRRVTTQVQELLALLNPDDVLIGSRNLPLLSLIARIRGCRWVEVGLNSGSMIDYEGLAESGLASHPWKLGLEALEADLREQLLGHRDDRNDPSPLLRLHAVPDAFVPEDYPQLPCHRTGFWCFEDPLWEQWSPPTELQSTLATARAPLGLALSSQPLVDPLSVLRNHLRVAELLGEPLILVKSWAFQELDASHHLLQHPALLQVDPLPYRWLFSRLDTAFIHGGMGTLAAALDGGCRLVIEPFGNDQFLNAKLTMQQGLAWAVHPHRFDPEQVAALLAQAPAAATRGIQRGTVGQSPGGIDRAVELLSRFC